MPFPTLCGDEPLVKELRSVFKANVLRIPEERVAPLGLLLSGKTSIARKRSFRYIGDIGSVVDGESIVTADGDLKVSRMVSLTNRHSRVLDNETGAEILSGLVAGLAEGPAPRIGTHFRESSAFRFSFPNVERHYIEIGRLGQLLAGKQFDRSNALYDEIVDPKSSVQLIDSTLTSADFTIESADNDRASFKVDVEGLKETLGAAKIDLDASDAARLTFRSKRRVAFGFSCVTVGIGSKGKIRKIAPSTASLASPAMPGGGGDDAGFRDHVLLTRKPEMIELEFA